MLAHRPVSLAIIGCAGGNGLDRLIPLSIPRIVALDVNPNYVATTLQRYAHLLPGLEGRVADIAENRPYFDPVDLLYCGLIFEHVDTQFALKTLGHHCVLGGTLVVVLQGSEERGSPVTPSPFESLRVLGQTMQIVDPNLLQSAARDNGFVWEASTSTTLATGKSFTTSLFRASQRARGA